jgi:hypothetical protein
MKLVTKFAALALVANAACALPGCEKSRDEMRPDMDKVVSDEPGLQSRDLREMTDKMAPDLLRIPEIVQNPTRVVVVMTGIANHFESDPTRDLTIYVARLKTLLNSSASRDRIAFVEPRANLQKLQAQELSGGSSDPFEEASRTGVMPTDPRVQPQYALKGEFYEMHNAKTSYYLCTFQLTDLHTGVQVWEGKYEVRTLNI